MTIRALIVDDEPLARERLRTLLADEPDIAIAGECANGREAVAALERGGVDLVFLDVQMPELSGFDVVHTIGPERMPATIFVTAYDQYAIEAFEVHALDYLLKPFDRERFTAALERARAELHRTRDARDVERRLVALLQAIESRETYRERLVVKSGGRVSFVRTDEVDWIEAAGNYAKLHVGSTSHLVRETMRQLATRLDPKRFVRIHRSAIVNVERIEELQTGFHGEYLVVLRGGARLTSSRGYSQQLHELIRASS